MQSFVLHYYKQLLESYETLSINKFVKIGMLTWRVFVEPCSHLYVCMYVCVCLCVCVHALQPSRDGHGNTSLACLVV